MPDKWSEISLPARNPITERLSLNSGVDYSICNSTVHNGKLSRGQSVHYLGIPLIFDYSFIHRKHLDVYVGAGPEIDWCLKAKIDGSDIDKEGPGISINAVAGIQFNFNPNFGLFIEPWGSYYFQTNRQILNT